MIVNAVGFFTLGVPRVYGCPQCGLSEACYGIDKMISFVVSGVASHYEVWKEWVTHSVMD